MPVDRDAVLNDDLGAKPSNGLHPKPQRPNDAAAPTESIATANQTIASRIRRTVSQHSQRIESLWEQRTQVTKHIATEYAEVLDPNSISQEIACNLVTAIEERGAVEVPFVCEPIELTPVRRFIPSLPGSVGSVGSLPPSA